MKTYSLMIKMVLFLLLFFFLLVKQPAETESVVLYVIFAVVILCVIYHERKKALFVPFLNDLTELNKFRTLNQRVDSSFDLVWIYYHEDKSIGIFRFPPTGIHPARFAAIVLQESEFYSRALDDLYTELEWRQFSQNTDNKNIPQGDNVGC